MSNHAIQKVGIIIVLKDVIIGTILGLVIIAITNYLDYHGIIHIQSAHHLRESVFQLVDNDPSSIEEYTNAKFIKYTDYQEILNEMDSIQTKLNVRTIEFNLRSKEAIEKQTQIDSIRQEHTNLVTKGNDMLELSKWCEECKWIDNKLPCRERVDFMKRTYHIGEIAARVSAMDQGSCQKK